MKTAEEFIIDNGYPTWYVSHSDDDGEVVINHEDCKQAMIEFAQIAAKKAFYYGQIWNVPDQSIMDTKVSLEKYLLSIK